MFIKSAILATTALLFTVSAQAAEPSELCKRLQYEAINGSITKNNQHIPVQARARFYPESNTLVMRLTNNSSTYNLLFKGTCTGNAINIETSPGFQAPQIILALKGTVSDGTVELRGKGSDNEDYAIHISSVSVTK